MRLIDVDLLKEALHMGDECEECEQDTRQCQYDAIFSRMDICSMLDGALTVGGWISVEDRLPDQHKSIFAPWYGRKEWIKAMWKEESDRVIVAIKFPDGTTSVGTARLHDGEWSTDFVSLTLNPAITHWMPLPEPPAES